MKKEYEAYCLKYLHQINKLKMKEVNFPFVIHSGAIENLSFDRKKLENKDMKY